MIYAYLRVSSQLQADANGCASQREAINRWLVAQGLDQQSIEWHEDSAVSGKSMKRPAFDKMRAAVAKGDTILFYDLSRAGRTLRGLIDFTEEMVKREVRVVFIKNQLDISTSMGRLILHVMASIAEFQREEIGDKISDGVRARRDRTGRWGPPSAVTPEKKQQAAEMRAQGRTTRQIAAALGVSERTVERRCG